MTHVNTSARMIEKKRDEKVIREQGIRKGILLSLASGFLASVASVFAKLALDTPSISLRYRLFLIIVMIVVNSLMWMTFSKALDLCPSSVVASVLNTICNFTTTGILGVVLFNEIHVFSIQWSMGMIMVVLGLCLILHEDRGGEEKDEHGTDKKEKNT